MDREPAKTVNLMNLNLKLDQKAIEIFKLLKSRSESEIPKYRGINMFDCLRMPIWHSIGFALRSEDFNKQRREKSLTSWDRTSKDRVMVVLRMLKNTLFLAKEAKLDSRKAYIYTRYSNNLHQVYKDLAKHKSQVQILSSVEISGICVEAQKIHQFKFKVPNILVCASIYTKFIKLLQGEEIELSLEQKFNFFIEILTVLSRINSIDRLLNKNNIRSVVMAGDNWGIYIIFALVAKKHKIPFVSAQHGLDCETFILDECFAPYQLVWADASIEKKQSSDEKIQFIKFPNLKLKNVLYNQRKPGNHWLYIARPHCIAKCHAPSSIPNLGLQVLFDIASASRHFGSIDIRVKLHPYDNKELYLDVLKQFDNVSLAEHDLTKCLEWSSLVFAEDSTAAIEALATGVEVVKVHYSQNPEVVDLDKFNLGKGVKNLSELNDEITRRYALPYNSRENKCKQCVEYYFGTHEQNEYLNVLERIIGD